MPQTCESRRACGAAGLGNLSCVTADGFENKQDRTCAQAKSRARLKYRAGRLHALGPKPLFHFLNELERGADLRSHLERNAALPADFIKALGGDVILPPVHLVRGGG